MTGIITHSFNTRVFKGEIDVHTELFINGEWVKPVDKTATIEVFNPSNQEVISSVSVGDSEDLDKAVVAALKAYHTTWGLHCPGNERGRLLSNLADQVEKHAGALAALESLNVGKPYEVALGMDVQGTIQALRYYAGWADKVQGQTIETNENKLAYTRREPYGVVGQIVPWNFPLILAALKIAPAVATGNTVVLKPSELTPLTTLKLADLIQAAGFPPGVVNIVNGLGGTVGAAIGVHPKIAKVSFTGSIDVGRQILRASSESNLKDVTLELGGKNPSIIFDDADLDQATQWAAKGAFLNAGQGCIAGSRLLVQKDIYEQFLKKFTAIAQELEKATGGPFEIGSQHGPLISKHQFERVLNYIKIGKAEGATVHTGGQQHEITGNFIEPTIFTDVTPEMRIAKEEIFGPVGVVMKFKTEDEAIEMANASEYGLSANVFSKDISRALRVAHKVEAGTVWVNTTLITDVGIPFGGYKQSGVGREMGDYALDTYTQVKAVQVNIGKGL